jgi:hypothetical protein
MLLLKLLMLVERCFDAAIMLLDSAWHDVSKGNIKWDWLFIGDDRDAMSFVKFLIFFVLIFNVKFAFSRSSAIKLFFLIIDSPFKNF